MSHSAANFLYDHGHEISSLKCFKQHDCSDVLQKQVFTPFSFLTFSEYYIRLLSVFGSYALLSYVTLDRYLYFSAL